MWYGYLVRLTKTCPTCGVEFSGPASWMIKRRYCSLSCNRTATRVEKVCPSCGRAFVVARSLGDAYVHCSKACQRRSVSYVCEQCGRTHSVQPSVGKKRFCSDACRLAWFSTHFRGDKSPHWQGGVPPYYGPNWKQQRNAARRRDNQTCQHCGRVWQPPERRFDVAHLTPSRLFEVGRHREANALANLITLCRTCHLRFDHGNGTRT